MFFAILQGASAGIVINLFDLPLFANTHKLVFLASAPKLVVINITKLANVNRVIEALQANKKIILNLRTTDPRVLGQLRKAISASVKVSNKGAIVGLLSVAALPTAATISGYEQFADVYHAAVSEKFPVFFLNLYMSAKGLNIFTTRLKKLRGKHEIRYIEKPVILSPIFLKILLFSKRTVWKQLVDISHNLVIST